MFLANAIMALGNGLIYLLAPQLIAQMPVVGSSFVEAPQMFGDTFCGAVQVAFGVCGWLALVGGDFEKFKSVLLFQCIYKTTFLLSVAFHYGISGRFTDAPTSYEWFSLGIFVFFAVGNGMAILFWDDINAKKKKAA